jgi:uncharacterized membrane protein
MRGSRHPSVWVCLLLSIASLALFAARLGFVAHPTLTFLLWNLFLAWIPYLLAGSMHYLSRRGRSALALGLLGLVWLLFFPNAPYIVTDLLHVEASSTRRALIDSVTISAFAVTGLVLGYASLIRVQALVQVRLGALAGWIVVLGSLILSGAGVYLGRVHQLNSWDVVTRPSRLLATTRPPLADPLAHTGAIVAAALGGTALAFAYVLAYRAWGRQRIARTTTRD